ncbi:MAG: DUF4124 domain-containing protein [Deltaproteobacteria bacterium]|nr:DUF4124 domain-containing protein [Deltaproteobacteria bacterium]
MKLLRILFVSLFICLWLPSQSVGKIYRWVDEKGTIHFSNTPPSSNKNFMETEEIKRSEEERFSDVETYRKTRYSGKDLHKQLAVKFFPKNNIEAARNATVKIWKPQTPMCGSGFFITENGYILTNKHVVKSLVMSSGQNNIGIMLIDKTGLPVNIIAISKRLDLALLKLPAVSEFMSQKLELITLHGMVNEGGATGVSPFQAETKGEP